MTKGRRSTHYINNKDFLVAIVQYKKDSKAAKKAGKPKPKLPDYIAKAIMSIANNLSNKPNFAMYTFKEEMIGDAIENCIMYFDNFDPKKSKNPFAYFTQIIMFAFIRRIQKEKKLLYTKYKMIQQIGVLDEGNQLENEDGTVRSVEMYENISDFIYNYEEAESKKKREVAAAAALLALPKEKKQLENFMEDDAPKV